MLGTSFYKPKPPNDVEKYLYTKVNSRLYKLFIILHILSWGVFLYNFHNLYHNTFWLYLFFGIQIIFICFYNVLSLLINLLYPKFNVSKHYEKVFDFWQRKRYRKPTIDVFLPVCGEDIDILENTWEGVATLKSKHYHVRPIVLDDKNDIKVKKLAENFEFNYLSRPNRGELKKAGNLKFGFQNTKSDFIIILDADFTPRSDFIIETLPYMDDPKVGIVQTPQYFDKDDQLFRHSPLMYGAGAIQEYFYRIIQPARSVIGGAICVGTCAIYRRKALDTIGGTYQIEHSEDVYTGFALKANGFDLTYLPLILSKGLCPDDSHAFFKQQTRWCLGSMSLMLNKKFWQAKISF
ncbi:MAG: glycosyltransferase family 2 protein, partial [Patescibacteria group bacterium]